MFITGSLLLLVCESFGAVFLHMINWCFPFCMLAVGCVCRGALSAASSNNVPYHTDSFV